MTIDRKGSSDNKDALVSGNTPPSWFSPMLATLTQDHFSDPGWIYERKLDGERVLAVCANGKIRLFTRNRKEISDTYPELVEALSEHTENDWAVDGEVVAFDGNVTSFSRLQKRMKITTREAARSSGVAVFYYMFDIVHLDGMRLNRLPLRQRKTRLKKAFAFKDQLRYMAHRNRDGEKYFELACTKGWEGVIAKRADSAYQHFRSRDWFKFKCTKGQELVIGGFTAPRATRIGFGALLVGYYDDSGLRYAGKVGTGFNDAFLATFRRCLDRIQRKTSPFVDKVADKSAFWVTPCLVGEFGFSQWTEGGKLRHSRFKGLRRDKEAKSVVRETAHD